MQVIITNIVSGAHPDEDLLESLCDADHAARLPFIREFYRLEVLLDERKD